MRLQCLVSHSFWCLFPLELLSGADLPSCQMAPHSLLTSCSVSLNVFLDWEKCTVPDLLDCSLWQRKQSPVYGFNQMLWEEREGVSGEKDWQRAFSIFFPLLQLFLYFSCGCRLDRRSWSNSDHLVQRASLWSTVLCWQQIFLLSPHLL